MRLRRLLLPVLLVPALLATPVLTLPAVAARPVAPAVVELPLEQAAADRRTTGPTGSTLVLTEPRSTTGFGVLGVTWDPSPTVPALDVDVRTRTAGVWSGWTALDVEPDVPSGSEAAGTRPGTAPLFVGEADGVQTRVVLRSGPAPTGLRLALVDPGESPADRTAAQPARPASTAHAAGTGPDVRPRAAWGADESIRGGSPSYAARIRAVTLHHTASSSSYSQDDVPALLRGFYGYHVRSNGWSDIGYNFLVDRFGTIWEGRAGGTTRAVIGAHAGGFNTGTAGVSMIGTYETTTPSAAMLEGVAQVAGWKLGLAGVSPTDEVTLTSAGSTRHASGTPVRLPTIFPHRAVSTTSCPGTQGIAALPGLRTRAAALAAGATPLQPAEELPGSLRVEVPDAATAGSTVDTLVRGVPGRPVQVWFAGAEPAPGATLRREGSFDDDGIYRTSFVAETTQVLFAVSDGVTSPRVRTSVGAGQPPAGAEPSALTVTGPVTTPAGAEVLVTVAGPVGTRVSVWFRPHDERGFVRRREGTLGPDGTFTTTYTSTEPMDYFAMSSTVTSADATTLVGPVPHGLHVTSPSSTAPGVEVPVVVQGTPGAAVELWFSRSGGPFTRRREAVLAADGTYRTSWSAQDAHTLYAVSRNATSTRVTTTVPGSVPYSAAQAGPSAAPTTTVAPAADAGATVPVTVTGLPGRDVALWFRARGQEVFTRRRAGTFDAAGTWTTTFGALEDHDLYATSGSTSSGDVSTLVQPVLAAPATASLGTVVLTGRARPGDVVVVEQRRRSNPTVVRRTVTAARSGAWRLPVTMSDESQWRPTVNASAGQGAPGRDRVGAVWTTTRVSPRLVAPARSGRGSTVRLTGTARPGAVVEVLFRKQGGTVFTVGRRLRADATGAFTTTAVLGVSHRAYARSEGLASAQRIITVR